VIFTEHFGVKRARLLHTLARRLTALMCCWFWIAFDSCCITEKKVHDFRL